MVAIILVLRNWGLSVMALDFGKCSWFHQNLLTAIVPESSGVYPSDFKGVLSVILLINHTENRNENKNRSPDPDQPVDHFL